MEDDMVQKQTYLRTEILEKQYDPQKFIEFLNTRLSIGDDLSLCSLSQLQQVVQEFLAAENASLHLDPEDPVSSLINSESQIPSDPVPSLSSSLKPRTILFVPAGPLRTSTTSLSPSSPRPSSASRSTTASPRDAKSTSRSASTPALT